VLCRTFVGRVAELDHLLARRRAAAAGRGGTVLVAGPAGIGKSRLLSEFRRSFPRRATRVASGACRPFAQRPLGPWVDVLAQLDAAAEANLLTNPSNSKDEQMAALFDTFARVGERAATVVLLEDIHSADPDILQLLVLLTERASSQRILFVATYRDDELNPSHPCFPLLGRLLRDHATSLCTLESFDDREVSELLRNALPPGAAFPGDILRDVQRRCEGNALFAEELLRHAVDRFRFGDARPGSPLPISLQAVVADRLTRCGDEDRAILSRASLFERSFDIDMLATIFEAPDARYRGAMERLCALQLVDSVGPGGEYRFRHALTRDVVYAAIPPDELKVLHGQIAEAIALRYDAAANVERLAHHYWFAERYQEAAPFCLAAGEAARAMHALARAYQERAVELAGQLSSGVEYEKAFLAQIELRAGHLSAARSIVESIPSPRRFNARVERAVVALILGHACTDDELETTLDLGLLAEARDRGETGAMVRLSCASAPVLERLGRQAEADRLLADAARAITTTYDMTVPIATIARLRPDLALGLRPLVEAAAMRAGAVVDRALLAFLDAAAARERRDGTQRAANGRSAAKNFADIGWHVLEAQAYELAGDTVLARERYAAMGAYAEVRRLERSSLDRLASPDEPALLTSRERELVLLVAAGKSYRAAAEALSVSEKTVEKSLTPIYSKLGVTSRVQLAAYIAGASPVRH